MKTALRGTLSSPRISPLGRKGKVPECESQTPRPAAGRERQTGWVWDAPGDGTCRTGQKSVRLERKLSAESHQLCNAGAFLSLSSSLLCLLFGGWPMSESPLIKLLLDSHFPQLLHILVIDVFLFKHTLLGCFPLREGSNQQPTPSSLDHSRLWPLWIISSLVWGVALKAVSGGLFHFVLIFLNYYLKNISLFIVLFPYLTR